jgi:hypothetical protein
MGTFCCFVMMDYRDFLFSWYTRLSLSLVSCNTYK